MRAHCALIYLHVSVVFGRVTIEHKSQGQAVIYVCNHQSTTDIMLLYGELGMPVGVRASACAPACRHKEAHARAHTGIKTHFKWVSKSSNFYIPLIGWNMGKQHN